jgi:hypothetical protein
MVARIALVLAVVLGFVSTPLLSAQAAPGDTAQALKRVDGLLNRSVTELRVAERFADQKHLGSVDKTVDQGMRLVRSAEVTADKALAMLRRGSSQKLSKAQGEQIERLVTQAQNELRRGEEMIDRAAQKSEDHKRLRTMVRRVDRQVDEAVKLLHQIVAGM